MTVEKTSKHSLGKCKVIKRSLDERFLGGNVFLQMEIQNVHWLKDLLHCSTKVRTNIHTFIMPEHGLVISGFRGCEEDTSNHIDLTYVYQCKYIR